MTLDARNLIFGRIFINVTIPLEFGISITGILRRQDPLGSYCMIYVIPVGLACGIHMSGRLQNPVPLKA